MLTFLTEADQERTRPRKTIKKNGPHRSQSLSAFPGSSLYGFGNTTSFRLLTILDRSLFTVSHTGSVSVSGGDPNPDAPMPSPDRAGGGGSGGADAAGGTGEGLWWLAVVGGGGGRLEGRKGEEETGIRGGLGGRAGRTEAWGLDWSVEWIRFSISSMSDWDVEWRGMVSPCDIFARGFWI